MSALPTGSSEGPTPSSLDRLVDREEVLQICYWFQGEGLGEVYSPKLLGPFLNRPAEAIAYSLQQLVALGDLKPDAHVEGAYRLSASGKKKAGKLFAESFSEFQKQGHGECDAGCCDGDDHSQCGDECALH